MSEHGISYAQLAAELGALQLATTPTEAHGAVSGWLAGGGALDADWLRQVMADASVPQLKGTSTLAALGAQTQAALDDPEFGFTPLLPEGTAAERGNALFDWCRSFLSAFGLSGAKTQQLSDEAQEAMQDLAQLARSEAEPDAEEDDEAALAEIEEFVRVAVLLMAGDMRAADARRQLH